MHRVVLFVPPLSKIGIIGDQLDSLKPTNFDRDVHLDICNLTCLCLGVNPEHAIQSIPS